MKKLVIFTMGGKGGVGKTAFMVNLAEYFEFHKIPKTLIDCDIENKRKGSLSHYFPEAVKVNIRKPDGLDIFLDATEKANSPVVIADLGAGAGFDLTRWFKEMFPIASKHGINFLAVGSVTSNPGSLETVFSWANELQNNVKYLIVKNYFQGEPKLWLENKGAKTFRRAFCPVEIQIDEHIPKWQTEFENYGLTLTAAMKSNIPLFKNLGAKCRIEYWRNQIFEELDKCKKIIVP